MAVHALSIMDILTESFDLETQRKLYQRGAATAIQFAAAHAKLRHDSEHNPVQYEVG